MELTRRAYRRPVTDADVETPLSFYQTALNAAPSGSGFDAGIESALTFILTSPEFLFRVEPASPGDKPGGFRKVGDMELASRLSFFLWSSIPDDELLQLAAHGKLQDPAVLEQQVRRMLADRAFQCAGHEFRRAVAVSAQSAGHEPGLPDLPEFRRQSAAGFERETELFFDSIVHEDRSVLDLLRANYTFVNERLAKHYGIPNVYGTEFRRVTLPGDERRGLLGQGSILTVTSYATEPRRCCAESGCLKIFWARRCLRRRLVFRRSRKITAACARVQCGNAWKSIAKIRPAPVATTSWILWDSRWKISMRSGRGARTVNPARPLMPPGNWLTAPSLTAP